MNFRELINKLDQINEAEGLTLQSIAAVEKAAMDKATAEKAKGGLTGFATWDPRTAGNIALAKLAQQNNFEGLFNSEGDFVVAYGTKTWSSNSEMHPGEKPRIVPPTPDDWKPLAAKGLIPQNANGPAGLTNWLSGGGAQKEFDAVKKQSADAAAPATTADPAQDAKVISSDEEAKMTLLEGLVDQYLALKTTSKKDTAPVKGNSEVAPGSGTSDGDKKSTSSSIVPAVVGGATGYALTKPKGKLRPGLGGLLGTGIGTLVGSQMAKESIATSLVESFGYQKKNDFEKIVESFGYQTEQTDSLAIDYAPDMEIPDDAKHKPVDKRNVFAKDGPGVNAVRALGKTISGNNKTPVSKDPQTKLDMLIDNKYWNNWTEDSLSWDTEIIPGFPWMDGPLYSFADLGIDIGIGTTFALAGAVMAPFTAGASVPIAAAAGVGAVGVRLAARVFFKLIKSLGKGIANYVKLWGKPFWEFFIKGNPKGALKALGQWAKTYLEAFFKGMAKQFSTMETVRLVFLTMGFNVLSDFVRQSLVPFYDKNVPDSIKKPVAQGADWVADKAKKTIDDIKKQTGWEEGLA